MEINDNEQTKFEQFFAGETGKIRSDLSQKRRNGRKGLSKRI